MFRSKHAAFQTHPNKIQSPSGGSWRVVFHLGVSLEPCGCPVQSARHNWQERWEYAGPSVAPFRLLWNHILTFLFTTTFLSLLQPLSMPQSALCKALVQLQQFPVAWKKHWLDYVPSVCEDKTLWEHCLCNYIRSKRSGINWKCLLSLRKTSSCKMPFKRLISLGLTDICVCVL